MKLYNLVFAQFRRDPQGTLFGIGTRDVADQKITLIIVRRAGVHGDAEEQRVLHQRAIIVVCTLIQLVKNFARRATIEHTQLIACAGRDEHRFADWAAALRDRSDHFDVAAQA